MRNGILDSLRLLVGFLLVPPIASIIAVLTYDAMWHLGLLPAGVPIHTLDSAVSLGFGIFVLAAVTTVGGVVPGVLWLAKQGRLSVRSLVVLGAVLGNVPLA